MTAATLTLVTANIGRGETTAGARANLARVRKALPKAVVGWQEIDEADAPDEHRILRQVYARAGEAGWDTNDPITVPTRSPWRLVHEQIRVACPGLAKVTPTRHVVEAVVEHPRAKLRVVLLNGHYPLARLGGDAGQQRWDQCHQTWRDRVAYWHGHGYTVLTTRDTNQHGHMPSLHADEHQLLPPGIDRINVIPAEPRAEHAVMVHLVRRRTVDLTIDGHDAHAVDLRLTPTRPEGT